MTRILYWNIDLFSELTIENADMSAEPGLGVTRNVAAGDRSNFILSHLRATVPDSEPVAFARPDIIVIIEVSVGHGGYTARGNLVGGQAETGALLLLERIRESTENAHWMLIPPLLTGPDEGVAIYYDSSRYCFTGPWTWPGGTIGPSRAPGQATAVYGGYVGCLPNRPIPLGLPNAGVQESQVAMQVAGFTNHATIGDQLAGGAFIYPDNQRSPCLATLAEVTFGEGPPIVGRTFSLFAVHSQVRQNRARINLERLRNLAEIVAPAMLPVNDIRLVLGDFNFNLMTAALVQDQAYTDFAATGFTLGMVQTAAPPPPGDFTGYRGFFATHILSLAQSTYWRDAGNKNYYPCYGYIDGTGYSFDNVLARFGLNLNGDSCGELQHVTVLNGVVGAPYNDHARAFNEPIGYFIFDVQMQQGAEYHTPPSVIPAPPPVDPRRASFPQWDNYGRIRSTSSHMPILFEV